jgi:phosphoenolpyruvate carboxykinase (GTP)
MEMSREQFNSLTSVDREVWQTEVLSHEELFLKMFDKLPKELLRMRELIISSLWRSPEHWEQIGDVHPEGWNE